MARHFLYLFTFFLTLPITAQAQEFEPYNMMLDGYDYPYEVSHYKFEGQQQKLDMAYMDVSPEGEANGEAVLLLHGKNFNGAYWEDTIAALTEAGYRVIAPDQIGFGKSTKPEYLQYTFQSLATWTNNLLSEAANVERVHVVGHSMGGMLATRFALMFPDVTTSLSLVNPIGLEDWKRKVPYQTVDAWYQGNLGQTPQGIIDYQTEAYFDGEWKPEYVENMRALAGWTLGDDYERIAWNSALHYDMIFTQPVVYEFGQLEMPTLLLIGTRDRTALGKNKVSDEVRATMGRYNKLGKETAEKIPNAELVEFENVGHMPQVEVFDDYISSLKNFLKEQSNESD